jgi:hypothetical protein
MSMLFSDSKVMQVKMFFEQSDDSSMQWTMTDRELSQEFKLEGLAMFLVGSWFTLLYVVSRQVLQNNNSSFTKCARRKSCVMVLMTMVTMCVLAHVKKMLFEDIMADYGNNFSASSHSVASNRVSGDSMNYYAEITYNGQVQSFGNPNI